MKRISLPHPLRSLLLLTAAALTLTALAPQRLAAQDFSKSERLLHWLQAAEGDSVMACCDEAMCSAMSPAQAAALWKTLQQQFGAFKKAGEWQERNIGGHRVHLRTLHFERQSLEASLTWEGDRLAGLFFRPAEAGAAEAQPDGGNAEASRIGREVAVEVQNGKILLPATLRLPDAAAAAGKRVPCAILVHGSGPADRDETVGATRFFRQLADTLAAAGIASLRYEKRTRVYGSATRGVSGGRLTYDEESVDDAVAAVALAAECPEVDADRLFIVGHSLGAMLAPRIAERCPAPLAGLVALAPPARKLPDIVREQLAYIKGTQAVDTEVREMLKALPSEYLKFDKKYAPAKTAARLSLPMLILFAGNDYQVTSADAAVWETALRQKPGVTLLTLPALNHLFAPSPAKARPEDYLSEQHLSGDAARLITGFIKKK